MTVPISVLTAFSLNWNTVPHRLGALGFCARLPSPGLPQPLVISGPDSFPRKGLVNLADDHLGDWERVVSTVQLPRVAAIARRGNVPDCYDAKGSAHPLDGTFRAVALPTLRVCGLGEREVRQGGRDHLIPPPMEHVVRLPRAHLATFTDDELRRARLLLRGFYVMGIRHRESAWGCQGSHLQKLHLGATITDVDTQGVTLEVGSGFQGGHADDLDGAQRWSGYDGYLMSLHLVAIGGGEARDETAVARVSKGADSCVGTDKFASSVTPTQARGMTRLEIEVEAMNHAGDLEPDEGRLLKRVAVDMNHDILLKAEFSNGEGVAALPFSGRVLVTRSSFSHPSQRGNV